MWKLTSKTGRIYYLLPEKEKYIVGRSNADLVLNDDTSISRIHAYLFPCDDNVKLIDAGSKYGTYYNENIDHKIRMDKDVPFELKNGERVCFGLLNNEWILSKMNLVTLTSTLNTDQRMQLKETLKSLNGEIIESFAPNCTHLTMSGITVTSKFLYALVERIPIVNCQYWRDYLIALRNGNSPPNPDDYLPEIVEEFLKFGKDLLKPNEARKTLFAGKTFVFFSKKQYDIYMSIIPQAGGKIRTLNEGAPKTFFTGKNVIVIQYVPSTQSQFSQKIDDIAEYVESKSLRMMPDYEIGLALVNCSIEKYCNPNYNVIRGICSTTKKIENHDIIAEETPINQQINSTEITGTVEVPESNIETIQTEQTEEFIKKKSQLINTDCIEIRESNIYEVSSQQIEEFTENKLINKTIDDGVVNDEFNIEMHESDFVSPVENFQNKSVNSLPNNLQPNIISQKEKRKRIKVIEDKGNNKRFCTEKKKKVPKLQTTTFLNSSQIVKTVPQELNIEKDSNYSVKNDISKGKKRGRFAVISDDDDDDLFDFGKSLKKSKSNDNEELSCDLENFDNINNKNQNQMQSFNTVINKNPDKTVLNSTRKTLPIKQSSTVQQSVKKIIKITPGEWLSKSLIKLEIKDEETSNVETAHSDWIGSIKDAFEVRSKEMNLSIQTNGNISLGNDTTSSSMESYKGKNFKAFVKKRNYIPQKEIVRTVPFQIHGYSF